MPKDDELELDDIDDTSPTAPRDLRKYAERQAAKAREAESLGREVKLLRYGINTDSKLGKAFMATLDVDIDDKEAVLKAAEDFPGIIRAAAAAATAPEGDSPVNEPGNQVTPDPNAAPAPTGTEQRRALADGALPTGAAVQDPVAASHAKSQELRQGGATWEVAVGEALALQAQALNEGKIPSLDTFGRPVQR